MNRFVESTVELEKTFEEVVVERFPSYVNINFMLIFDTKKKKSKGKIVLASTELTNDKLKFLSSNDEAPEGYDYNMIFDLRAWEAASEDDRKRLISHELNHIFIDEKGRYKLVDHDVNDFLCEVKNNEDAPDWNMNLSMLTENIYEQEKDFKND